MSNRIRIAAEITAEMALEVRQRAESLQRIEDDDLIVDLRTLHVERLPTGGEPVIDERVRAWRQAGLRQQKTENFGDMEATPANGRPWYKLVPIVETESAG